MHREFICDLGDGLVVRQASVADTDSLVAFHGELHSEVGAEEPEEHVAAAVQDLLRGDHPTCQASDFTVVEDTATGQILSSLCLISQHWCYGGVELDVGRPELVATRRDYRNRGLVRAQFDIIHDWSAERGHVLQGITGIPYFYRQFGYEMTMTLGGARIGYAANLPGLPDGEEERYRLRPALESDLGFMSRTYEHGNARYLVTCQRDEELWHYELLGRNADSANRWGFQVIEAADGSPVGYLAHSPGLVRDGIGVGRYELQPGISWAAVSPSVMRQLWTLGEELAQEQPGQSMSRLAFWLGSNHPAYQVLDRRLPHTAKPYAWFLRVPDVRGFLQHVGPVLEQRLAHSVLVAHSGELQISFYRSGARLVFEGGQQAEVSSWQPTPEDGGHAAFPDQTFLQLLFGYRTLDELKHAFADCWTSNDEAQALLEVLFPMQESQVWAVE